MLMLLLLKNKKFPKQPEKIWEISVLAIKFKVNEGNEIGSNVIVSIEFVRLGKGGNKKNQRIFVTPFP